MQICLNEGGGRRKRSVIENSSRNEDFSTIVEIALPLIEQLPPASFLELCERTFQLIILIWNAHAFVRFWSQPQHLAALGDTLSNGSLKGLCRSMRSTRSRSSARGVSNRSRS